MSHLEILLGRVEQALADVIALTPNYFTIKDISKLSGKNPDAIRKELFSHYQIGKDYIQKKKNGIIYVAKHTVIDMKRRSNA
jgi:hypothetical protein